MKSKKIKRIALFIIIIFIVLPGLIALPTIISGYNMYRDAVDAVSIEDRVAEIRADENFVTIDSIAPSFLTQLIAAEDQRFYSHGGIDLISTGRALLTNVKSGSFSEGGSSITQQLAKNMYFTFEKRLDRKVAELLVAFRLEKMLTKDEILDLYCNIAYFGENMYGIREASLHYYGIEPIDLSEEQSGALVLTLKSPSVNNPNSGN
jgi:membrane peptidoglycan carboxypeptidase